MKGSGAGACSGWLGWGCKSAPLLPGAGEGLTQTMGLQCQHGIMPVAAEVSVPVPPPRNIPFAFRYFPEVALHKRSRHLWFSCCSGKFMKYCSVVYYFSAQPGLNESEEWLQKVRRRKEALTQYLIPHRMLCAARQMHLCIYAHIHICIYTNEKTYTGI